MNRLRPHPHSLLQAAEPPSSDVLHATGCAASSLAPSAAAPCVPSAALLQGHSTLLISHNGTTYRLQATRQGKLILTK